MYRIWFERPLPSTYTPLLEGVAVIAGTASETPAAPFSLIGQAEAIIAGGQLAYDAAVMAQAPHLRVIARTGIGLDNVDLEEATRRGIAVCNAPDAPTLSTAEHTIGLMFAVAKQLKWCDQALLAEARPNFFTLYNGLELYQARLGLLGLGRIGGRVAQLGRGLGMTVVGYDPFVTKERAQTLGVELLPTIEAVLETADVVSLHLPLTSETRGLINADRLARMKPEAILINAARGGLVDEAALVAALDSGHLRGAGVDVFVNEPPPPDHPLLGRENVVVTPHIASATGAGKDRLWRAAIEQAIQVLRGERPPHLVNPAVWPHRGALC